MTRPQNETAYLANARIGTVWNYPQAVGGVRAGQRPPFFARTPAVSQHT